MNLYFLPYDSIYQDGFKEMVLDFYKADAVAYALEVMPGNNRALKYTLKVFKTLRVYY